jgi:ABC-type uncharacterized transport system permease subunit
MHKLCHKAGGMEKVSEQPASPIEDEQPQAVSRLSSLLAEIALKDLRDVGGGLLAIAAALVVVAIMIAAAGIDPLAAYGALLEGSVGSVNGISETLVRATPLILIGLGIAIAFRGGMWNIGGEGQFYLGALGAVLVGVYLPPMPAPLHILLALLCGFAFGGLWAAIPGYLRVKRGANEIVVTIMMNYLATFLISFLVAGPLRDNSRVIPVPQTAPIASSAVLPRLIPQTRAHAGLIVAIIAAVIVWFVLERTALGYSIKATGENPDAASYGGINVAVAGTLAMGLSGGLAGLAGMGEVAGVHRYLLEGISPGYGYLAIAVALFGGLNPLGVVLSALFFGALMVGADAMQRAVGVPVATIYLLQGLVVIFVLARQVLVRRRRTPV